MVKDWNMESDEKFWSVLANSFKKKAQDQVQPTTPPKSQIVPTALSVAKKLSKTLADKFESGASTINVTVTPPSAYRPGGQSDVALKADNLANIDVLLDYLWKNKVAVDGDQIVYRGPVYGTNGSIVTPSEVNDDQIDQWQLADLTGKTVREADQRTAPTTPGQQGTTPTRHWETQNYFFRQPLLIKYIQYLQQKATDMKSKPDETPEHSTGQMLSVYVSKLITDLNNRASTNIPAQPRAVPGKPTEMPDYTILDSWTVKSFDARNPGQFTPGGHVILHAGNMKSLETLNDWMLGNGDGDRMSSSNQIASVIAYDDKNVGHATPYGDTVKKTNNCIVINTLFLRARNGRSLQRTEEGRKVAEYYFSKVQELGKQFTDPDGNPCTVNGTMQPATQSGQNQNQGQGQGQGQEQGQSSTQANITNVLNKICDRLPLALSDIDFSRIENFLTLYGQLIPLVQQDRATAYRANNIQLQIQRATDAMKAALPHTAGGGLSNFSNLDGLSASDVMSWAANPTTMHTNNLVSQLQIVITSVVSLITDLNSSFGKQLQKSENTQGLSDIRQQLYIGRNNFDHLRIAQQYLPRAGVTGK